MLVVPGVVWFSNMMPREMGVEFFSAWRFQSQSQMNGDPKKGFYPNISLICSLGLEYLPTFGSSVYGKCR